MPSFNTTERYEKLFDEDSRALLIEMHSEEAAINGACGAAILADVLKTCGVDVDQEKIIADINAKLAQIPEMVPGMTIVEMGTPPSIIEEILTEHEIEFKVKDSVPEKTWESSLESEKYLDEMLRSGHVVICPIQTVADPGKERDINEDGHYIIVCGEVFIEGQKHYITIDPMFHYYQRLANEGRLSDVLHEIDADQGYFQPNNRDMEIPAEALEQYGINPKKYGYRLIDSNSFVRNWKDISALGKNYNEFGIAIKMRSPEFHELGENLQTAALEKISESEILGEPWKSEPSEPYALRQFNPSRSQDTVRFKDIDRHPEVYKWMDPPKKSSNEDLDWLIRASTENAKDPRIFWAIVGEKNEALGWIQIYKDENITEEQKQENNIPQDALVLEVSYSKLPNQWPKHKWFINDRVDLETDGHKGVAVNGLKQSIIRLSQMEDMVAEGYEHTADKQHSINSTRPLYITAYTVPDNFASEKVLEKNGFENKGLVDYDGEQNYLWVKKAN